MHLLEGAVEAVSAVQHELLLFAAIGFALGGLDDLAIDILYFFHRLRLLTGKRAYPPKLADLSTTLHPGKLAIFIPAWDESNVIGAMLARARAAWARENMTIFVGVYPNDPATAAAISPHANADSRIITVTVPNNGPTTKADCLNGLWRALEHEEQEKNFIFKGVILHDAEDVVHPDELRLFDRLLDDLDMAQLPVVPIPTLSSRWIARHYGDEFAESHGKSMVVRQMVGAAVPSAGVGCVFRRSVLGRLPMPYGGPFDPGSLTEDYELGLRIADHGGKGALVRIRDADGQLISTREIFPETFASAVRQKARWSVGIAWAGWDRMGWHGSVAEHWMRLRDRRDPIGALVLVAGYSAALLQILLIAPRAYLDLAPPSFTRVLDFLLPLTLALLIWRAAIRILFAGRVYGWRHGLMAAPRMIVANVIAIRASLLAFTDYLEIWRGKPPRWKKTRHRFPLPSEMDT